MKKVLIAGLALQLSATLLLAQNAPHSGTSAPASAFATEAAQRAFLNQYCVYCHNDQTKSGGMSLTSLDLTHITHNGDLPEKMIRKLRVGLMPPPGMSAA